MLRKWEELPSFMQCDEVRKYYDILSKKKISLRLKRIFDVVMAEILLVIFAIPMLIIAMMIKLDSWAGILSAGTGDSLWQKV